MNPYIYPIKGDLARADIVVLQQLASKSHTSIFEFGVGGSSLILSKASDVPIVSFDDSTEWMERTKKNLSTQASMDPHTQFAKHEHELILITYPDKLIASMFKAKKPDLLFVDSNPSFRFELLKEAVSLMTTRVGGGIVLLHDTRRDSEYGMISNIVKQYGPNMRSIHINHLKSNMTIFEIGKAYPYVNWNEEEAGNNRIDWFS
jgi:predicted O-methyltransferase YrrM